MTTQTWIPVSERLPESGTYVIAFVDRGNKWTRRIRAMYAAKFTEETMRGDEDAIEYCEADDNYYVPEGWYEANEYEETHRKVSDPVTHWMPLPPAPQS